MAWSVCLSIRAQKRPTRPRCPSGAATRIGPRNNVSYMGVHDSGAAWRIRLNDPCLVAMRAVGTVVVLFCRNSLHFVFFVIHTHSHTYIHVLTDHINWRHIQPKPSAKPNPNPIVHDPRIPLTLLTLQQSQNKAFHKLATSPVDRYIAGL